MIKGSPFYLVVKVAELLGTTFLIMWIRKRMTVISKGMQNWEKETPMFI